MAAAFFVGKYLSEGKHTFQLNQAIEASENYKKQNLQLRDSISHFAAELEKTNSARKFDSMAIAKMNSMALKKGQAANKGYMQ